MTIDVFPVSAASTERINIAAGQPIGNVTEGSSCPMRSRGASYGTAAVRNVYEAAAVRRSLLRSPAAGTQRELTLYLPRAACRQPPATAGAAHIRTTALLPALSQEIQLI